jgi:hypothetical protein
MYGWKDFDEEVVAQIERGDLAIFDRAPSVQVACHGVTSRLRSLEVVYRANNRIAVPVVGADRLPV